MTKVLVNADRDAPDAQEPSQPTPSPGDRSFTFLTRRLGPVLTVALVLALAAAVLGPVVLFYSQAFADGATPIRSIGDVPNLGEVIVNTLLVAVGSTVLAASFAVGLGLLVMRTPMRVRSLASFLPQVPLVVPPVAMIIGWTFLFAPRVGYVNTYLRDLSFLDHLEQGPLNVYSLPAIVLITSLDLTGIIFALIYARLYEIGGSLNAAARLSGATAARTFWTVTLPLLRPALVSGVVVAFLLGLGTFTAPLLLGGSSGITVLSTEIFRMREQYPVDYGATAALGLPLLAVGIISIVVQRRVVGDQRKYVTQSGGSGGVASRSSRLAFPALILFAVVTTLLPLAAVALVAFSPFWSGKVSFDNLTTQHVSDTLSRPGVVDAITNSLVTSLLAAAIVLPLGFVAALLMSGVLKAPRGVRALLDITFLSPLAVPRALLGLAVLYVFLQPPFSLYGTMMLFVVGYAFVVLPFSMRSQYSSLISVHPSLFESSRICGAGQFRTVMNIALPLARRGMAAALAIMMILLSQDFAVSVMLRSPGNHVMGTVLYDLWETGSYPVVAVMALVMSGVTAMLLGVAVWIGGRSALSQL